MFEYPLVTESNCTQIKRVRLNPVKVAKQLLLRSPVCWQM